MSLVNTITEFIENTKIFISETFAFLPSEIYDILIAMIVFGVVIYLYRLVR